MTTAFGEGWESGWPKTRAREISSQETRAAKEGGSQECSCIPGTRLKLCVIKRDALGGWATDLVVARPRGAVGFGFDAGIGAAGPLVVGRAARAVLGGTAVTRARAARLAA